MRGVPPERLYIRCEHRPKGEQMIQTAVTPFKNKINSALTKKQITVLQINLGKRCNLACTHCHVEASPTRTEELSPEICDQLIEIIRRFPQIQTVDLTGGAPEMLYGFKPLAEAARAAGKEVIVRFTLKKVLKIFPNIARSTNSELWRRFPATKLTMWTKCAAAVFLTVRFGRCKS